jgi:hypothetical protein
LSLGWLAFREYLPLDQGVPTWFISLLTYKQAFSFSFLFFFEIGSCYVARLASNSQSPCLSLPGVGITGVNHHAQLEQVLSSASFHRWGKLRHTEWRKKSMGS